MMSLTIRSRRRPGRKNIICFIEPEHRIIVDTNNETDEFKQSCSTYYPIVITTLQDLFLWREDDDYYNNSKNNN